MVIVSVSVISCLVFKKASGTSSAKDQEPNANAASTSDPSKADEPSPSSSETVNQPTEYELAQPVKETEVSDLAERYIKLFLSDITGK